MVEGKDGLWWELVEGGDGGKCQWELGMARRQEMEVEGDDLAPFILSLTEI